MATAIELMTVDEYLAFERAAATKHEFYNGEVIEMSGGSRNHSILSINLAIAFQLAFRAVSSTFRTFNSDMRVQAPDNFFCYPDLSIASRDAKFVGERDDVLLDPVAICEVLSPSTEVYDRTEKFQRYESIPSLQMYVLISQTESQIEFYTRKTPADRWTFERVTSLDAVLPCACLGVEIAMAAIYQDVDFAS